MATIVSQSLHGEKKEMENLNIKNWYSFFFFGRQKLGDEFNFHLPIQ